jgi:hypothetical protein
MHGAWLSAMAFRAVCTSEFSGVAVMTSTLKKIDVGIVSAEKHWI